LPQDWHINLAHLCTVKTDGLYAVQSALDELKRYSYAKFERPRDRRGRFGGSVWLVFERPFTGNPVSGKINNYKRNTE
jgi:hypothetical protein